MTLILTCCGVGASKCQKEGGESRSRGAAAAHRACLKGSEAGPVRERGREVMCEVLGRASQIGVSDTGWGSPSSLIAVSWRPGAFAQPLWVWISS